MPTYSLPYIYHGLSILVLDSLGKVDIVARNDFLDNKLSIDLYKAKAVILLRKFGECSTILQPIAHAQMLILDTSSWSYK